MSRPGPQPVVKRAALMLSIFYPALLWLTDGAFNPAPLALVALLLLAGRWLFEGQRDAIGLSLIPLPLIVGYALWLMSSTDVRVARLYPVLVNLMLLLAFAWTLWHPPSMAERLARAVGVTVSPAGIAYTRWVTAVWSVFFCVNGIVSAVLAWRMSLTAWALYTGLLSYLIALAILLIELVVRRWYRLRVANS